MSVEQKIKNLARPKESNIEKKLVQIVLKNKGKALKIQGAGNKGMPDRLCILPGGKSWFVELKRPGKKPDNVQFAMHQVLKYMGFKVSVIWNNEQLKQFENEIQAL